MDRAFSPAHVSWAPILNPLTEEVKSIFTTISGQEIAPDKSEIFEALRMNLADVRCVIVGQDPYPTAGHAHGLAFSVPGNVKRVPPSLKNIFTELESDMGIAIPPSGDLSPWRDHGVLLLNRVLTTQVGASNVHLGIGWEAITEHICKEVGSRGVPAILWGTKAQELDSLFPFHVSSVHPSPLSAYRGFFGSKPFSRINAYLEELGRTPIDWSLR